MLYPSLTHDEESATLNPRWLGVYRSGQVKLLKHLSLTLANGTLFWIQFLIWYTVYERRLASTCARVNSIESNGEIKLHYIYHIEIKIVGWVVPIPSEPKKWTKLIYYYGYLAVSIRFSYNPFNPLWLWHRIKRYVFVVYFKMTPQRDKWVKVSALLRAGHKVSDVANAKSSTRSRSVWSMAKVLTCVQAVVKRLLSLE